MRKPKIVGIRGSRLINQTENAVAQWDPTENSSSGYADFYNPDGTIELRIERFTKFAVKSCDRRSALKYIRGLPWQICVCPDETTNSDGQNEPAKSLAIYLYCKNESSNTAWNCQVKDTYRVVSQKEGVDDYVQRSNEHVTYNADANAWGYSSYITFDKLLDPEEGFIKDDTVIFRVDVKTESLSGILQDDEDRNKAFKDILGAVDKTHYFSTSTEYPWDFMLIVQSKKVYIQKNILSIHSEYFKDKFEENRKSHRAVLRNIDHSEFVELLSVIYPTLCSITVENVETIAKLAYVFKMKGVLRQCEAVLVANASKFGKLRIFLMAHWYNLVHLQAICVDELKAIGDLQQLAKELEYAALDCRAKAILLDKIIESSPNPSLIESTTTNHGAISNLDAFSNARASNIMDEIASSDLSNGVLIVQNKRIPIQKVYLAMFSKYFKAMFLGEFQEKNQDEVVLEEVGYTDILEILAIIYPCGYPITDENLKVILKMADRFIMPDILERCKKFLKCSQKIKRAQKLWLAQQYNFPDLQVKYARQYKNVEEVKKLKAEPEYELLDITSRSLIFDSITTTVLWEY